MEQNEKPLDIPEYLVRAWQALATEDRFNLLVEWREKELEKESSTRIDLLVSDSELRKYSNSSFEALSRQIQLNFRGRVDGELGYTPPFESRH